MGYLGLEVLPAGDIASSVGKTSDRAGLYTWSMVRVIGDVDVGAGWFAEHAGLESSGMFFFTMTSKKGRQPFSRSIVKVMSSQ